MALNERSIDPGFDVIVEGGLQERARTLRLKVNLRWLWAALVVLLSGWILRSFFQPLVWASVIAVATWPIYRRFAQRLPGGVASNVAPLLFTVLVSIVVLGPMLFAFGALISEAHRWFDQIAIADKAGVASPAWLESLPIVGAKLAERWQAQFGSPGGMSVWLERADTSAALGWARTLGQFMAHHMFIVIFTLLVLCSLYRSGDALALRGNRLLYDSLGNRAESYVALAIRAVRATVNGMVVVALFDGVLTGVTYALAGVQRAEVWGAVTGLFAMIPFLGYVAVAGVAMALAAKGAVMAAIAVFALGLIVLFAGDKIVRPMLVGGALRLGFVWVLMGSLGGLELLGLLGLFVGPVVLALGGALWHDWTTNRGRPRGTPVSATATD